MSLGTASQHIGSDYTRESYARDVRDGPPHCVAIHRFASVATATILLEIDCRALMTEGSTGGFI